MLMVMVVSSPIIEISFSIFCILIIDSLEHIYCVYVSVCVGVTAIVLSMGTKFVNKDEICSRHVPAGGTQGHCPPK